MTQGGKALGLAAEGATKVSVPLRNCGT